MEPATTLLHVPATTYVMPSALMRRTQWCACIVQYSSPVRGFTSIPLTPQKLKDVAAIVPPELAPSPRGAEAHVPQHWPPTEAMVLVARETLRMQLLGIGYVMEKEECGGAR